MVSFKHLFLCLFDQFYVKKVHLDILTAPHLANKFVVYYGIQRIVIIFMRAR